MCPADSGPSADQRYRVNEASVRASAPGPRHATASQRSQGQCAGVGFAAALLVGVRGGKPRARMLHPIALRIVLTATARRDSHRLVSPIRMWPLTLFSMRIACRCGSAPQSYQVVYNGLIG